MWRDLIFIVSFWVIPSMGLNREITKHPMSDESSEQHPRNYYGAYEETDNYNKNIRDPNDLLVNAHVPLVMQIFTKALEKGVTTNFRCTRGFPPINLTDYLMTPTYLWSPHSFIWQYEKDKDECMYFQLTMTIANKGKYVKLPEKFQNVRILGLLAFDGCHPDSCKWNRTREKKFPVFSASRWDISAANVNNYKIVNCGNKKCSTRSKYYDNWSRWTNLNRDDTCIQVGKCIHSQYQYRMCAPSSYIDPNKLVLQVKSEGDFICIFRNCIPKCFWCEQPSVRRRPCECVNEPCPELCNYMLSKSKDVCESSDSPSVYIQNRCTRDCNIKQCQYYNAPNTACSTRERHSCGLCSKCIKTCNLGYYNSGHCFQEDIQSEHFTYSDCYTNKPCSYKCSSKNYACDKIVGKAFLEDYVMASPHKKYD